MVDDATAVAATTGVTQVFDLHALKDFAVPHDVRNLGHDRLVIMFLKVNPKVFKE